MSMIASLLIAEGSLFSWKERGLMSLILSQEDLRAGGLCDCLETPKIFQTIWSQITARAFARVSMTELCSCREYFF